MKLALTLLLICLGLTLVRMNIFFLEYFEAMSISNVRLKFSDPSDPSGPPRPKQVLFALRSCASRGKHPGNDVNGFFKARNIQQCYQRCRRNRACDSFIYNGQGKCWMKRGEPPAALLTWFAPNLALNTFFVPMSCVRSILRNGHNKFRFPIPPKKGNGGGPRPVNNRPRGPFAIPMYQ